MIDVQTDLSTGTGPRSTEVSGKVGRVETGEGGSGYGEVLFKQVGIVMSRRRWVQCLGVCEVGWNRGEPGCSLGCVGVLKGTEKRKSKRRDGRRGGSRMRRRRSSAAPQVNAYEVQLRVGEGTAVRALKCHVSKPPA
jgi:hypothetical protein